MQRFERAAPHDDHRAEPHRQLLSEMGGPAADWLSSLPPELSRQRRLLEQLTRWCEAEPAVSFLAVGCSLTRGNADALSDLDVAIGASSDSLDEVAALLEAALGTFSELVGHYRQPYGPRGELRRVFAQYADRTQIDAVVAGERHATLVGVVALYDRDGVVVSLEPTSEVEPAVVFTWASQAWEELTNVGKYLRRGALWEARQRLEQAREHFFRLWAVRAGAPEPGYGITALFDLEAPPELPAGIDETLARLEASDLVRAARRLAGLLAETQDEVAARLGVEEPRALALFVEEDLAALGDGRAAI